MFASGDPPSVTRTGVDAALSLEALGRGTAFIGPFPDLICKGLFLRRNLPFSSLVSSPKTKNFQVKFSNSPSPREPMAARDKKRDAGKKMLTKPKPVYKNHPNHCRVDYEAAKFPPFVKEWYNPVSELRFKIPVFQEVITSPATTCNPFFVQCNKIMILSPYTKLKSFISGK